MAGQVLADLEAIRGLQLALGKFNAGSVAVLAQVSNELSAVVERIEARICHWQAELRRREARLQSCVNNDRGDCRSERLAVEEAREALKTLQRLASTLEKSIGEYKSQESRFNQSLASATQKGRSDLDRSISKYEDYLTSQTFTSATKSSASSTRENAVSSKNPLEQKEQGLTWSQQQELLHRWLNGERITSEEFDMLRQLPVDLQEGTVAEDNRWLYDVMEANHSLDAMHDSQEALDLRDAILATLKAYNYWRSK